MIVSVDGPSASGKSTVSRIVAGRIAAVHVDSGSLYRAVALHAMRRGAAPGDAASVVRALDSLRLDYRVEGVSVRFLVDGIDPGPELRSETVNENVSWISAVPEVRTWAVERLRAMAALGAIVMEGRDIGTVVFPKAPFKFYLDAAPEERARRRHMDPQSPPRDLEEVMRSIRKRDSLDSTRATAPLRAAPDAIVIESTGMSAEAVADRIVASIQSGLAPQVGEKKPWLFLASRMLLWIWLKTFHRFSASGSNLVPAAGPVIIASNHASFLDPPLVGCGVMHRFVRFMARDTLFEGRLGAWWARNVGVICIDRTRGDLAAFKAVLSVLQKGGVICLFPEGTRSTDGALQAPKAGVGFLIIKSGAPVVPARVRGTFEAFAKSSRWIKPRKVSVQYGHPIEPAEFRALGSGKEAYRKAAELVMEKIAALGA